MEIHKPISVGNLLLDIANFRIVKQDSQPQARAAIIAEQGKKLVNLAKDILAVGLNPFDLPLVIDAADGNGNFIVIEGNRRLAAIQLMLKPELAEGTSLHAAFKKLNKEKEDSIPQVMECVIAPNRESGQIWIDRKHASGLEGAGTDAWSAMSKARADAYHGIPCPELDVVNFVLSLPNLDEKLRKFLQGSQFNITTLKRLIEATDVQEAIGFTLQDSKVVSDQDKERIKGIFTEITTIIADKKYGDGKKFTERDVDTDEHRIVFLDKLLPKHPKKKKASSPWTVSGKPADTKLKAKKKTKSTPTTEDQINLIPRKFKLELPAGKINDIFDELKELDATKRRHAVSVLFRVFFDLTLDDYIAKHGINLPEHSGRLDDRMKTRLKLTAAHVKSSKLLSEKEMKPIRVAMSNEDSFTAPDTLNAYVHSRWMNPNPLELKLSWANFQLFIERLWTSKTPTKNS
jgi:hypothetical protein